jgi:hypothetical protein
MTLFLIEIYCFRIHTWGCHCSLFMHCQCFEIIIVYLRFCENFEKLGNFQIYIPQIRLDRHVPIRHVPLDLILMYFDRQVWYVPFTIVAQSKIALWAETNATDAAAVDASDPSSSEGVQKPVLASFSFWSIFILGPIIRYPDHQFRSNQIQFGTRSTEECL